MPTVHNSEYIKELLVDNTSYKIYDINKAASDIGISLNKLPYSLRVLLENVLRTSGNKENLLVFKEWLKTKKSNTEIDFMPARVLMQDFTGVPAIVDLAAMRDAMQKIGCNPLKINPLIPVDLVIDHSVSVDSYGLKESFEQNVQMEMKRNIERYQFLKWGQQAFNNFKVVPPGTGICHQVNLEYLSKVVWYNDGTAYPDSLVGTDSHTTMVNGLSVLGWGVGGIEAEAAMLGQPLTMIIPEVIGVKLTGKLEGMATATDLVLTITEMLRRTKVVGKFVEFFGYGLSNLTISDRATISNMSPEYGATCGFFPIDQETIKYLEITGRETRQIKLVEKYATEQNLWYNFEDTQEYTEVLELDLSTVYSSLAGPKRPQDRVNLSFVESNFKNELPYFALENQDIDKKYAVANQNYEIGNGDVVIAAITSCTNTSNPSVMIGAALLAKKALEHGLNVKPWVKTSLAPGSKVVTEYLKISGLDKYLDALGFNLVGYGCTTCIGNSGSLNPEIENTINKNRLVVASVLSGNRNFEGRINPLTKASYLASPILVVAYALSGTLNIDLTTTPIGANIYLKDIWPSQKEIDAVIANSINPSMFIEKYADVFNGTKEWHDLHITTGTNYNWDKNSTYINNPPYFDNICSENTIKDIKSAKILAIFGDSITTDHISPAGSISKNSPAAKYLIEHNIEPLNFNSYGSRRGNHEVMMRGTFANIRIKNEMCNGVEGGFTINQLSGVQQTIYDAAMDYQAHDIPLVVFAGKEYGSGSSRDWAAKGPGLLGIKAIIAESFERIHRSNLVGMGILPLTFTGNNTRLSLKLDGSETIDIIGLSKNIRPFNLVKCVIKKQTNEISTIDLILQIFTENEINYIKHGSIMQFVVESLKG
ncbi:aconitate hydratase AcnA [Rickettsia typhi]|uniref:Aconitate hydratase A n=2 Tax=Rickettsia typhi TaxID=785 RepID=ACNA_RICTY|nr:aconitate hydratase AcnA [Rickettsia typhi]Q68VV0.1 RecName: Full=Aconitate hydratase A; Short=ACN; Short=Aconitase; AltName: Full=(2R,3S)-2-methylisocitrate dehydratase; AltName: Full=(2S,3R)-3-hydroxybutane-1,2,3-tricarboxylate dehydratase; AltName: Full=Iron-responsive protein-like; Short=IRP-like; AltName: Full=Probable 2-methyl-cis-aconitate hydratase; AltName: Full=RNA-binding protein [Rickettsia typhi str. Wilmington]AAU04242.1 Aconitase [Rickettsia typhi str. Wilmington]AFE54621.1 aco